MIAIYDQLVYNPLLNGLVFLYQTIAKNDLGVAIILLTIIIRIILYPVFKKSIEHQVAMQAVQPKVKKAQEEHAKDPEKQTKAILGIYKEHNLNPFAGFLFIFIQIPILIALYQIFLHSTEGKELIGIYSFITAPEGLNTTLLGLINLAKPSIVMAGLAAIAQYFQGKSMMVVTPPAEGIMASFAKQAVFIGPIVTLIVFSNLAGAVSLYWLTTSVFSVWQQQQVNKKNGKLDNLQPKTS